MTGYYKGKILASLFVLVAVFGIMTIVTPPTVSAATAKHCNKAASGFLGLPTWYKYLNPEYNDPLGPDPAECTIHFPKNEKGEEDVALAIGPIMLAVVEILLRVGAYLAIGVIVWAGIQYQLSQGDPERTKASRTMILNAVIGLVIAISATAIVNIVGRNIS